MDSRRHRLLFGREVPINNANAAKSSIPTAIITGIMGTIGKELKIIRARASALLRRTIDGGYTIHSTSMIVCIGYHYAFVPLECHLDD